MNLKLRENKKNDRTKYTTP